ncbi:MAG: NAD(P)H-dependent oxidoreductase subunit E [Planctomyces sp.]|nr:NAD(P)H-dependent oxidoreductase subunit E [Planctomyces sp.]
MTVLSDELKARITAEFPKYPNKRAVTLPALHMVHDELRHVSVGAIRDIAELLELHPSEVHDTMSFYQFFRTEENPLGKHRVWVCRSISCGLRGGEELLAHMCEKLHVTPGGTTEDGKITLEFAECLGVCDGAPCVLVDEDCVPNVTHEQADQMIAQLKA